MKLIKMFIWIVVTLIIAYFLSDLKVGGQTIKQQIDGWIHGQSGSLKSRALNWMDDNKSSGLNSEMTSKTPDFTKEEISKKDQKKLKKLLEAEQ